jgi:hypothetical protein
MSTEVSAARIVVARLSRASSAFGVAIALLAVIAGALLERLSGSRLATDRALTGVTLGLVLPLWAYGVVARALGGTRLDRAFSELARYGACRRRAAFGALLVLVALLAVAGALVAALAVIVTRAPADPVLVRDLATSTWIGALGGASYAAWFVLGSSFGRNGGGRSWALIIDWVLGAGASAMALPWPRGHLENLLGGEPVLGMPQWSATIALVVLGLVYSLLAIYRSPS